MKRESDMKFKFESNTKKIEPCFLLKYEYFQSEKGTLYLTILLLHLQEAGMVPDMEL